MKFFNALKMIWNSEGMLFTFGFAVMFPFVFLMIAFPMFGFVLYVSDKRFAYFLIAAVITNIFITPRIIYLAYVAKPKKTRKLRLKTLRSR